MVFKLLNILFFITDNSKSLQTDQVDVRIKAINLTGRLFALPGCHVAQEYRHVFVEFLNRFSDKSSEVRTSVLSSAKAFYITHPLVKESEEILSKQCKILWVDFLLFQIYFLILLLSCKLSSCCQRATIRF